MEVSARSGDCKVCFKVVTARQHALECDNCQCWVHQLCGTGITYSQYHGIMDNLRHGSTLPWICPSCTAEARWAAVGADEDVDNRDNRGVDLAVSATDIGRDDMMIWYDMAFLHLKVHACIQQYRLQWVESIIFATLVNTVSPEWPSGYTTLSVICRCLLIVFHGRKHHV